MKNLLKPKISGIALGIGLLYAVLGVVWILGSDSLVASLSADPEWRSSAQSYKGVFYVVTTSLALVLLVNASYRRLFNALERQQAQFRQLHQSLAAVLWMASPDGSKLLYVSPAIESMYGLSPEQVMSHPEFWVQAVHPDDAGVAQASHDTLLATGEASCEYRIVTKSGDIRWVLDRKRLIVDHQGRTTMMGGILEDISSHKAHEARLAASHDELEKLVEERTAELVRVNAELDAFARTIAHDLKSPLVSLVGFTQLLHKRHAAALGEDGARLATRIEHSARQMNSLVSDLLSLSRAATQALKIQDVDLVPLAYEILEELRHQEPQRQVRFDAPKSLRVRGDLGLLRPLLANLLGNAWKFTGQREQAHIQLLQDGSGPEVIVRLRDNGAGFSCPDPALLFKAFQRFHTLSEFSGTGIGLNTCERIMTRHGGRIDIASVPGEGTTVTLTFAPSADSAPAS